MRGPEESVGEENQTATQCNREMKVAEEVLCPTFSTTRLELKALHRIHGGSLRVFLRPEIGAEQEL